jgi:hypothetical protein
LAARIESWSKNQSLSVLEEEKRTGGEDGLQPGPSSVIFRYWRGHRRLIRRVNRKEYTVGFKVVLLLIVSAALAVSIEFPSLVMSHPNYPYRASMTVEELKGHSATALVEEQIARALAVKPGGFSDPKALAESIAHSEQIFENHPFPDLLPPDAKFPPFELTRPDNGPVGAQSQDSTSQSTSSSSLSDFYLKK